MVSSVSSTAEDFCETAGEDGNGLFGKGRVVVVVLVGTGFALLSAGKLDVSVAVTAMMATRG